MYLFFSFVSVNVQLFQTKQKAKGLLRISKIIVTYLFDIANHASGADELLKTILSLNSYFHISTTYFEWLTLSYKLQRLTLAFNRSISSSKSTICRRNRSTPRGMSELERNYICLNLTKIEETSHYSSFT